MNDTRRRIRCAVYTRKSTEEGLDMEFNSLDAQREAGEAYVLSQRHEGWTLVGDHYDDGGFSGGSMERPALKRLMRDVEAGVIDVIVVYKVDRLSRSLMDFAKLVEVFDRHNVSFVSVTQQFNTTTSMGRLTLNILLSFAQFEREVIGERIRDKFAASKRKGMWMGGTPPLGYDVKDRKLIVNETEAKQVRYIFERFITLRSVTLLAKELKTTDIRTKSYITQTGNERIPRFFTKNQVYRTIKNRLYLGEIPHRGKSYPGQHEAIIDMALWNEAHIRASRFPSPDASSETKTHDISGPMSRASCARSNPAFVSLRTSAGIYDWDSNKSTMTFDQWVTALRRDCLRRKKSVRPTSANGSSSWLTPRAQESAEKQETFLKRNGDRTDRCYGSLTTQTVLWPTATATDATVTRARPPEKMIRKDGRNVLRTPSLAETVMQPRDFPYTKQDLTLAQTERPYRVARAHTRTKWPTPRAQEPGSNAATHGVGLKEIVTRHWATPTARDWKDGVIFNSNAESRSNLSRQAPRTLKDGGVTSNTGLTLNPLFVEALMGWPIGWTDCASAVTGSSRWLRLMRSELSLLLQVSKSEEQLCLI